MGEPLKVHDLETLAPRYFPAALLYIGDRADAVRALTEALAAAEPEGADAVLPNLLRICSTRTVQPDAALSDIDPLLTAVWKLPAGSRRDLALHVSGIPDTEAARARGLSDDEYARRVDKANRQVTFLGGTSNPDLLSDAFSRLQLTDSETAGICARWTQAIIEKQAPPPDNAHEIVQRLPDSRKQKEKMPVWGILLCILCVVLSAAVTLLLIDRSRMKHHMPAEFSAPDDGETEPYTVQDLAHLQYISMEDARQIVREALETDAEHTVFSNTRLDTAKTPVCYRLSCIVDTDTQYDFTLDAVTGEILKRSGGKAMLPLRTENWLSLDSMRSRALSFTKLDAALTVREQLGTDGGKGYYRFQFQDAEGKIYTVQLSAESGILLKYAVELPEVTDTAGFISLKTAKQRAVSRAGDLTPENVVFTKAKLDGAVYLINFTLDDGTQYSMELDAKTGMTNTVDVHPVTADTSRAIGLLKARDTALAQAEITEDDVQQYRKAKIDRSNGAYVYELEFETLSYEYEMTLNIETGEIVKYKASYK